ncbi:MAG: lanthionine synthetase LanC family protein [Janthinobacterium lividum]
MTEFLEAAVRIGERLCAQAFWAEDRDCCNWMSRTDVEDASQAASQLASRAIGAHLYAGSGGIALFLLELARITGRDVFACTAVGAARHAARSFRRNAGPASTLSHFSGVLGLASVSARIAEVVGSTSLDEDLDWAVETAASKLSEPHPIDVMGGNAGAIPPLIHLWRRLGRQDCLDLAMACGRDICRAATWSGEACMWDALISSGPMFRSPPVTGYSHGASGLALAVLELHAAGAGGDLALHTARGAWHYEDSLFDPETDNWIDVRFPFHRESGHYQGTSQVAWCHGASGIALARARAASLDVGAAAEHRHMAERGIATTLAAMSRNITVPRHDTSLCHGLSGLGEIVLTCGQLLGDPTWTDAALNFGRRLVTLYGDGDAWPSAAPSGGPSPTLMIGDAGVGYHLLRLHDPHAVPSILITLPD